MEQRNWQQTRDILISVICLGIIFWALWSLMGQFVEAIVILLLSMAVAFLFTPAVNLLVKYRVPRLFATLIAYLVILGAVFGLGYALVASMVQQALTFSNTIVKMANDLPNTFKAAIGFMETTAHIPTQNINAALNQIQQPAIDFAKSMALNAPNILLIITNAFINILLVVVLSFYLTLDGKRIRDSLVSVVPKSWLPNTLLFEDALNRVVGNYIRGQLTLALIVGVCTSLICVVSHLENYALICGVLAFLFETIPMVGPALAAIAPILLSLLLGGTDVFQRTLIVIVLFVILQMIESNVLGPRIVGHAVGLHPVAAILSLIIGAKLFGVFGALLATPIVAAGWVVVASIYRSARGESADQMLARKRAPWQIRRPHEQINKNKRDTKEDPAEISPGAYQAQDEASEQSREERNAPELKESDKVAEHVSESGEDEVVSR